METVGFEAENKKELRAAVAQWLAMELTKKDDEPSGDPVIEPQHGGGGGP